MPDKNPSSPQPEIIVVGAGIIGSCVAWTLQKRGAKVTLIDKGETGGVASARSFGWINASYGNPRPYYELRHLSMRLWQRLKSDFPRLPYQQTGCLDFDFDTVTPEEMVKNHTKWGYSLELVTGNEIANHFPNLRNLTNKAVFAPDEGQLDVPMAARVFTELFAEAGGHLISATKVEGLIRTNAKIAGVIADGRNITSDWTIVAAGTHSPKILEMADIAIELDTPPGLLVNTKPVRPILDKIALTPGLHLLQRQDGSLLAGADFGGGDINNDPESGIDQIMKRLRRVLPTDLPVEFDHYTVGYRPTPKDGLPLIGPIKQAPGLYLCVMHSGATLAPVSAQICADEILTGTRPPMTEPFDANRTF